MTDARDASDDSPRHAGAGAEPDARLDARGLLCPLPVLKARKRLQPLLPGGVLEAWTDDPAAVVDIPHFCAEQGHEVLLQAALEGGGRRWLIRKGGRPGAA